MASKYDEIEKAIKYSIASNIRKSFNAKYCLVKDVINSKCSTKKCRCHTISKKASLDKIAVEGHVYAVSPNDDDFYERIGVNKATIFYGFCKSHDTELFSPVENTAEALETENQFFVLSYRSLCMRLYKKQSAIRFIKKDSILIKPEIRSSFIESTQVSINDLIYYKNIYDEALIKKITIIYHQ